MVFTSPRFLIFLGLVLAVLSLLPGRDLKKRFLALASCFFYAAWDWRYLGLLLVVSVIDYYCALRIHAGASQRARKLWLAASIVSNLGILAYFKYCNFFINNLNGFGAFFGWQLPVADILLPAGISFYTFKTMSYTIDVYRGELEPCHSWLDYTTFITFFPELIAGPIVRASIFLPQMTRDIGPTRERILAGASLFVQGLLKKLLVADRLATIADPIFGNPAIYSPATLWFGVLAYSIQIYCDFSGYSDMAIGTARMIGYDLPENFRMPYISCSITEFWRRWHMTLSSWLRDYLYIPLGGNRKGSGRTYINLMLTMLLGGLWHGASWNFVLWGGLHGTALALHKLLGHWRRGQPLLPKPIAWAVTLLFVMITWVPFRAHGFGTTLLMLEKMFCLGELRGGYWSPTWLWWLGGAVIAAHVLGLLVERAQANPAWERRFASGLNLFGFRIENLPISGVFLVPYRITFAGSYAVALVFLILLYFAPMNTSPFIYFQF
jgi:alginate O-acetyltransferase complex protein AlgI